MVDASPFSNANTLLSSLQFPPQKIATARLAPELSGFSGSTASIFGKNDQQHGGVLATHQQQQWNYLKIDLPASISSNHFTSSVGGADLFAHANGVSPMQSALRNDLFSGLASPVVSSASSADWANNIIASILSSPSSATVFPNLSFSQPINNISNGVCLASMARNTPTPPFRELSSPLAHSNGLSSPALSINGADEDMMFIDDYQQMSAASGGAKRRRRCKNSDPNSTRKVRKTASTSVKTSPTNLNATTSDFSPLVTGAAAAHVDEVGDDIFIDTKDLCNQIALELKKHSIPQSIFAERVLGRSQGTLSGNKTLFDFLYFFKCLACFL